MRPWQVFGFKLIGGSSCSMRRSMGAVFQYYKHGEGALILYRVVSCARAPWAAPSGARFCSSTVGKLILIEFENGVGNDCAGSRAKQLGNICLDNVETGRDRPTDRPRDCCKSRRDVQTGK